VSSSPYAFGIDLGTTNSAIAYTHDDMVKMVPMSAQETSIPSLFSLDEQGNPIIGEQAKNQKDPAALISASKRLIGRNFHRAEELQQLFTYDIIDGGDKNAVIPILDQIFTMEEISAAIIQQLCQTAKDFLGEDVQRAVLTVPTYFDERQRSAIKKAGELAGLEVLRILNEPTAAALAYGSKKKLNKCVAVYDLGGGTFDLSIVNIRNNSFEVLASGGNPQLGGVDFDDRILRFFLEHIYEKYGYDLAFDKGALSQLRETAEQSKIILSKQRTVAIALSLLAEEDEEEFVFSYTLTREKLEELTFDLIETTIKTTRLILKKLSYTSKDLDEVLLVGGQALMPCIHKELEKMLGYPPSNNVHPKEVVAKGAALMAQAILDKDKSTMTLQDRLPLTIGVRKSNGTISPLFQQGTILPSKVTRLLPTVRDRQKSVVLQLYQGNDPLAQNNEPLQIFVFSNIRAAPKGVIKVETLFSLNENGLLRVQARDKATKSRVRVQALSPQQFSALKQERDASLKKLSATIVDTKEKQEESLNKKPDLLVDADLMISKPFPNPLNMRLEEIAPTHKPMNLLLKKM
jgi:molecular chaperone DnaK